MAQPQGAPCTLLAAPRSLGSSKKPPPAVQMNLTQTQRANQASFQRFDDDSGGSRADLGSDRRRRGGPRRPRRLPEQRTACGNQRNRSERGTKGHSLRASGRWGLGAPTPSRSAAPELPSDRAGVRKQRGLSTSGRGAPGPCCPPRAAPRLPRPSLTATNAAPPTPPPR